MEEIERDIETETPELAELTEPVSATTEERLDNIGEATVKICAIPNMTTRPGWWW